MKPVEQPETDDATTTPGGPPVAPSRSLTATTANVRRLLDQVALRKRPCRGCGRDLWFVKMRSGREAPFTDEAINHFADCPERARFRRPKAAAPEPVTTEAR